MTNVLKRALQVVWEVTESLAYALGVFVVVYLFFFRTGEVNGSSSYPTWQEGEKFITDKISYEFIGPQRGEFVVVESPRNPDIDFLKRVIGLPGEEIKLQNGEVYINGSPLDESSYLPIGVKTFGQGFLSDNVNYPVPEETYFVLGDNRQNSSDSRDFGPIKRDKIVGRVIFRYWPPERMGTLK